MSSDWTKIIAASIVDDALEQVSDKHVNSPLTHWEEMPEAVALQVESARKVISDLVQLLKDAEIPIDKETYFKFVADKDKNWGKY
jgi:hypothetical protein